MDVVAAPAPVGATLTNAEWRPPKALQRTAVIQSNALHRARPRQEVGPELLPAPLPLEFLRSIDVRVAELKRLVGHDET